MEIRTKTDRKGNIKLENTGLAGEISVRVLILSDEDEKNEELAYLRTISRNPALDFLNEPEENVYTKEDGKPFRD